MHDTTQLEERGIPTVFVATREFIDGAEAQARALGAEPVGIFIEHPIQDRTDDEVRSLAERAFEEIIGGLTVN